MTVTPPLSQFRLHVGANRVAHLVFDCPGRRMNVFSNAAIEEIGHVASWLPVADVLGLVISSGKPNAFCAGADLTELGVAYEMIMAAAPHDRFNLAASHFFRLSLALRALEAAGKPVAVAIGGLALGGGCEFALAAHHRVMVNDDKVALGLPESLVGLLPGGGGTQRLPRIVGVERALPILLDGERLSGAEASSTGLIDTLCSAGDEVDLAERWVLGEPEAIQPWDGDGYRQIPPTEVSKAIASARTDILRRTRGHYPAPLAILDCVEQGVPQTFDGSIRTENAIFAHLIQREEPRDMIRTMFLAKTEFERLSRRNEVPDEVLEVIGAAGVLIKNASAEPALREAGFFSAAGEPLRETMRRGRWLDGPGGEAARNAVDTLSEAIASRAGHLTSQQHGLVDYALVTEFGYPAYLGGPLNYVERRRAT